MCNLDVRLGFAQTLDDSLYSFIDLPYIFQLTAQFQIPNFLLFVGVSRVTLTCFYGRIPETGLLVLILLESGSS